MKPCTPSLPFNGPFAPGGASPELPASSRVRALDKTTVLYPSDATPMRLLTPAERASLSYEWDPEAPLVNRLTIPCQAALRIRLWTKLNGSLSATSGSHMLRVLQWAVLTRRNTDYPWLGFELVRLVDATANQHGVHVYLGDQRLTDRLRELGWSE